VDNPPNPRCLKPCGLPGAASKKMESLKVLGAEAALQLESAEMLPPAAESPSRSSSGLKGGAVGDVAESRNEERPSEAGDDIDGETSSGGARAAGAESRSCVGVWVGALFVPHPPQNALRFPDSRRFPARLAPQPVQKGGLGDAGLDVPGSVGRISCRDIQSGKMDGEDLAS
jgi:hypothetical protein